MILSVLNARFSHKKKSKERKKRPSPGRKSNKFLVEASTNLTRHLRQDKRSFFLDISIHSADMLHGKSAGIYKSL